MLECAKKMKKNLKNDCQLKYFAVKGSTLEACRRTVTLPIQPNFTTGIVYNIKVLVLQKLSVLVEFWL